MHVGKYTSPMEPLWVGVHWGREVSLDPRVLTAASPPELEKPEIYSTKF